MATLGQIKKAVRLTRKNATPNVIGVNDVLKYDNSLSSEEISNYLKENLSAYEFICGYVQKYKFDEDNYVEMFMEHTMYHVQCNYKDKPMKWETFEKNSEARKQFAKFKKELKRL